MEMTKRDFLGRLGRLGLGGIAAATGAGVAHADEYKPSRGGLPQGSVGDPSNPYFGRHIFPLEHTVEDGPSCFAKDGRIFEPAKEIPIFGEADVVVAGGGSAGFAAAVASARAGAKTVLLERYGSLGGLFTNGMVLIVLATSRKTSGGEWELAVRGICREFMERAGALGGIYSSEPADTCPKRRWHPTIDPEAAKVVMDAMAAEAGVETFFHCWGCDVVQEGDAVRGVVFESKEGRKAILAKQVVDCTGDADMLFRAGGGYIQTTCPVSTVFRWGNMDRVQPPSGVKAKFPTRGNEGNPSVCWGSGTPATANGLSVRDLTRIEIAQRRENWERVRRMRATPGWEKVYTVNSASQIGVRHTRLVDAEFVTGRREIAEGRIPGETVCWCGQDGPREAFPVCYGQLVPKKIDNILCAGRCLGRGDTIDRFRLIAPCFATGQAAGVAAALAAKAGRAPRGLPYSTLRAELLRQGVFL